MRLLAPHVLYLFAAAPAGTWLPVRPFQRDAHFGLLESFIPELQFPVVAHSLQMQLSYSEDERLNERKCIRDVKSYLVILNLFKKYRKCSCS